MKRLILFTVAVLLMCPLLRAQDDDDITYLKKKKRTFISAAGTSVTIVLGGLGASPASDTGNALNPFGTAFTTPSSMTSPSWGNCHVYFTNPDSGNPNWGCALYADAGNSAAGYVNTQNAATGGCSSNCVTATGSLSFSNLAANQKVVIGGNKFTVSSVQSSTVLTLTTAPGTNTAIYFGAGDPGAKLCSAFSSTVAVAGWNSLSLSSCGTPSANTQYWVMSNTNSNTQGAGRIQGNMPCASNNLLSSSGTFSSFTSNLSWPSNFSTATPGPAGDGCIAEFMDLTYTTTNTYTIYSITPVTCDSSASTCIAKIPPTVSGERLIIWESCGPSCGAVPNAPTDSNSDTVTNVGAGASPTNGTITTYNKGWFIDRATVGTDTVTCNFANVADKQTCWVVGVLGTKSSSSLDQNCYDTSVSGSATFTGCSTGTTAQAVEFIAAFGRDMHSFASGLTWDVPLFSPTGSWIMPVSGSNAGNAPNPHAFFYQISNATGTFAMTGGFVPTGSTSDQTATFTSTWE